MLIPGKWTPSSTKPTNPISVSGARGAGRRGHSRNQRNSNSLTSSSHPFPVTIPYPQVLLGQEKGRETSSSFPVTHIHTHTHTHTTPTYAGA